MADYLTIDTKMVLGFFKMTIKMRDIAPVKVQLHVRIRNSGTDLVQSVQSNICDIFLPRIKLLSVLSGCP